MVLNSDVNHKTFLQKCLRCSKIMIKYSFQNGKEKLNIDLNYHFLVVEASFDMALSVSQSCKVCLCLMKAGGTNIPDLKVT